MACTYGLGVLDEDLGLAHLVLVVVHADMTHQMFDSLLHVAAPLRPRLRGEDSVTTQKLVKNPAVCVASPSDANVFF